MLKYYGLVFVNLIIIYRQNNYGISEDAHIITVPPAIIEKIENFGKSFDQLSTKETVLKAFLIDSKKSNFKI